MKVLLISITSEGEFGLLRYFERALKQLGHDARVFTAFDQTRGFLRGGAYRGALSRRIRTWFFRRTFSPSRLAERLKALVAEDRPDFALFVVGWDFPEPALMVLRDAGIPLYSYQPDPIPYSNPEFLAKVPLYTAFFTFNRYQIPGWYQFGAKHVEYLPFASDRTLHLPREVSAAEREYYASPIAYLATWQPHADYFPNHLVPFGLKIWGNQWYRLEGDSPARACWQGEGRGTYLDLSKVCSVSDVIFNVVRPANGSSHSMKTFEIPASGGFMLTNRTEEQMEFFPEDEGAVYFSSTEELLEKARFYLDNEGARSKIAKKGYELAQKHRYEDRMRSLVEWHQRNHGTAVRSKVGGKRSRAG